jgi:Protein of unknown function (DUF2490)
MACDVVQLAATLDQFVASLRPPGRLHLKSSWFAANTKQRRSSSVATAGLEIVPDDEWRRRERDLVAALKRSGGQTSDVGIRCRSVNVASEVKGVAAAALLIVFASPASGQTNGQFWGTVTVNWLKSDRLTFELELEPKVLVEAPEGEPSWASLDVTPNVEYAVKNWLDVLGELATGYTSQTDDVDTFELSPRIGVRFHLTTRSLPTVPLKREHIPRHRIVVRNLVRLEERVLFYTGENDTDAVLRFRNRLELQIPLNREKVSDDGARYVVADWEWFIPLDDPEERFANRQRVRAGIGYRHNLNWRFEGLYIWTRSRDTTEEGFRTSDNIVNIRVKRVF